MILAQKAYGSFNGGRCRRENKVEYKSERAEEAAKALKTEFGRVWSGEAHLKVMYHPKMRLKAMLYVIQTNTGREKELVEVIEKVLSSSEYKKCFVIQRECIWRIEGRMRMHIEPLFPSYVFVETDAPEDFLFVLKHVPKLTKLLGSDGNFWTVQKEEEQILRELIGGDRSLTIRLSPVKTDENGAILSAEGALKNYMGMVVKKRLRKRSVIVEIPFLGEMRRIQLGIRLEADEIEQG